MDTLLILISLSFRSANAASPDQHHRFVKRQQDSSSSLSSSSQEQTQTFSSTSISTPEHPLPASIQTRIPIPSPATPSGEVHTAIPEHPDPSSDKGPIIGFSIGIVALVLLFIATGWVLFLRYKQRRQQQPAFRDVVPLQPTNHSIPSITKKSFDDTQSAVSQT